MILCLLLVIVDALNPLPKFIHLWYLLNPEHSVINIYLAKVRALVSVKNEHLFTLMSIFLMSMWKSFLWKVAILHWNKIES